MWPVAFPSEPLQEEKSSDEACQIRSAIPTDTDISIEPDQKWVEVMNVEREPHRRHERSGAAQEFKELVGRGSRGVRHKKISRKDAKAQSFKTQAELNRRDEAPEIAIYLRLVVLCLRVLCDLSLL
jgi:hypothetical protein